MNAQDLSEGLLFCRVSVCTSVVCFQFLKLCFSLFCCFARGVVGDARGGRNPHEVKGNLFPPLSGPLPLFSCLSTSHVLVCLLSFLLACAFISLFCFFVCFVCFVLFCLFVC